MNEVTRWTRIRGLSAPEDERAWQEAWAHLTRTYVPYMVGLARKRIERWGGGAVAPDEAEDVVQSFLLACVEKGWLARADPAFGRFRGFVSTLLHRFTRAFVESRRAQSHHPKLRALVPIDDLPLAAPQPEEIESALEAAEDWVACLTRAALEGVRQRSEKNAEVLQALHREPDLDATRLAALVGIAPKDVALRKHRAHKMWAQEIWAQVKETAATARDREEERRFLQPYLGRYIGPEDAPSLYGRPLAAGA